ncbi:beta-galactosidase [Demequina rhizosphaerae]|uniref:beta-galactosidase n=1 Tax=Demequina rhizosphaerae TaxID=1638985 RepID=UPI000B1B7D68|nr:beta-galactosidase [Demequina rhizosphaerae]
MTSAAGAIAVAVAATAVGTAADAAPDGPDLGDETVLYDFDAPTIPSEVLSWNATRTRVGAEDGRMLVHYNSKEQFFASMLFRPAAPWDLSGSTSVGLAMDLSNPTDRSTQMIVNIAAGNGVATRSINVAAHSSGTYYIDIASPANSLDSGLRADPSWLADKSVHQAVWMWGTKEIDPSSISEVTFYVAGALHDKEVIVDNVRIARDAPADPDYLTGIVDKYGQNAKVEYEGKVRTDADLVKQRKAEAADLAAHPPLADRSPYGGWADGPKLEATGYFRTEKVDGKWAMVDPDGYLYFSTGIDNARLFDGQTLTGYDFDHAQLPEFDDEYVGGRTAATPEDLNRLDGAILESRHVENEVRANMFLDLPKYGQQLGQHYGYYPQTFAGPLEQGETFQFYRANLDRKYPGKKNTNAFIDTWHDNTVDRMLSWGFTSFGNWTDPAQYDNGRIPVFAHGWITGDYKTVSTGQDYWGPLPDPYDPAFVDAARETAEAVAAETGAENPWLVGVFMDNEKSWGSTGSFATHYGIVIDTLKRDVTASPTKAEFSAVVKEKYGTIEALNAAWGTAIPSWAAFDAGTFDQGTNTAAKTPDYSWLLKHYASEYFRVVSTELETVLPHHMYMGPRFASWGRTPEILEAAAQYVDVMAYNEYREGLHPQQWSFLADLDKPSLIGEFHFGATDAGSPHPALVSAGSQEERGLMYTEYMENLIDNPYMVGGHWFQYVDSPITGRQIDGENYNIGFVSVTDRPYPEMVDAAREVNSELYDRRWGGLLQD